MSHGNRDGLPPNLRREWLSASTSCHGDDSNVFTLMNYNILADCHIKDGWYPYCPQEFLKMSDRHRALMLEIKHHDPHIVCLQEVGPDYFAHQLNPEMHSLGYYGTYMKKVRGVMEGEATFYKKNRFEMVEEKGVVFNELTAKACEKAKLSDEARNSVLSYVNQDHLVLLTKLQDMKTKKRVSIGNTHLLFGDYKNIDVITLQAGLAINALEGFAGGPEHAHILCGDFNQEPNMTGYQLMHDGKLDADGEQFIRQYPIKIGSQSKSLLDILPLCFKHNLPGLKSAYKTVAGQEVPFTNYDDYDGSEWPPKIPNMDLYCEVTLDYQWFNSSALSCLGILQMINKDLIKPLHACPNELFPSDHFPILARYDFNTNER